MCIYPFQTTFIETEPNYKINDKVTIIEDGNIFGGIQATVKMLRQFQNASNDDWYWCAYLQSDQDENLRGWYPIKYIKHWQGGKRCSE